MNLYFSFVSVCYLAVPLVQLGTLYVQLVHVQVEVVAGAIALNVDVNAAWEGKNKNNNIHGDLHELTLHIWSWFFRSEVTPSI